MINTTDKYNKINFFLVSAFLIIIFFKIHFVADIKITGDELNSILVYSSNLKTLFLKNYPGNVTFFHAIGFFKSLILDYNLLGFRSITYFFFICSILIFYFQFRSINFLYILIIFAISSYLIIYTGLYLGYIFSSFVFLLIFSNILSNNNNDKSKLIFFLLFIQTYNHLVNLYLVIPIITCLVFASKRYFKHNIKYFLIFFFLPTIIFYILSITLTGLAEAKLPYYSTATAWSYLNKNLTNILFLGFNKIFFYEAYQNVSNFSFVILLKNIFNFDKFFFVIIIILLIILLIDIKKKNFPKIIKNILLLHIVLFFLINKDPAPRIFNGFILSYLFLIFLFFKNFSFILNKKFYYFLNIIFLLILFFCVYFFDFQKKINNSIFKQDIIKKTNVLISIVETKCEIKNNNWDEMEKKFYYYSYLNICKKKFNLNEFRKFYKN